MATTKLMTAADLAELTEPGRFELVWGELVEMSPTGYDHSKVSNTIAWYITTFVREHDLGGVTGADGGYLLAQDPDLVYAPDVAFVAADRLPQPDAQSGYLPIAPDLVVEVISPSDSHREVLAKVALYLELGVRLVWLADPEVKTVTVFRSGRDPRDFTVADTLEGEDILPGFSLPVSVIFR